MMKEVGDWVKAQSTIWYSNLFMIQYENHKWVEHLCIIKEVFQKLRPLI